ncbi:MAG: hypothetical protein ABSA67_02160 [Candidatus Brocadiia bacterium]|jgi:hypothetical protein
MSSSKRRRDYETLRRELRNAEYGALLDALRGTEPFFAQFSSWDDVVGFMRRGTSRDPNKDIVLRTILRAHAKVNDPRLQTALLAIFWPGLESIHFQKRRWDGSLDARWNNITWTFLQVVCRLNLRNRSDRLVQKIINDTVHDLYQGYCREWRQSGREIPTDPYRVEQLLPPYEDEAFLLIEMRDEHEAHLRRLREHVAEGRITKGDARLIARTRLFRRSLTECARQAGMSYQAAKKRRQRAEAAIRKYNAGKPRVP